jgi:EAL domain-containing protein (putative c-di-GMP-specific phosphodiesterase class I)
MRNCRRNEHESQLQYLKEHDCDRIQGNLISKPLREEDVFKFLKNNIQKRQVKRASEELYI